MTDALPSVGAPPVPQLVDHLFRHHYGRLVASLTRLFGPAHLDLVEDMVAESLLSALKTWPFRGVPDNPGAWLSQVAKNRALDALRKNRFERPREEDILQWAELEDRSAHGDASSAVEHLADDSLRMIFTCCHPGLSPEARVALTLKTLCGFSVPEIARAFVTKETTIAQRLVRAKRRIEEDALPFDVPPPAELPRRLDAVLEVLYLMFNEGYAAHQGGDLVRRDLVDEALRLSRLLLEMPATRPPKVHAVLALMCLLAARLPARVDAVGELLTLARQDRALWDRSFLALGMAHFERAIEGDELTVYHCEAAIAACHAAAQNYCDTDWRTVLARYDQLLALNDTPIVRLNRAVAVAKVHGAERALRELDTLEAEPALAEYYLLPATRGLLLWTLGRHADAAAAFRRAVARPCSEPERHFLEKRIAACEAGGPPIDF